MTLVAPGMTPAFEVGAAGAVARIEGAGLFVAPLLLSGSTSDREERVIPIELLPGARVGGRVFDLDGKVPAGPLRLRIESEKGPNREAIEAEVDCSLNADGSFSCPIPADRNLDLRLRSRGFASLRFWDRRALRTETVQVGELRLVPGGSVIGSVVSELPGRADTRLAVSLIPLTSTRGAITPLDPRVSRLAEARTPDVRGNFAFEGLGAGIYTIRASQPGAVDVELAGVRVLPGAETEIREPLRLRAPISLSVYIDPPYFRQLEDWNVALWRSQGGGFSPVDGASSRTDGGAFVARNLAPGRYRVDVSPPLGGLFASQVVEVEPPSTTLTLAIDAVDVEGRVRLGEAPLWSRVTFLRAGKSAEVSVETNEEGVYAVVLPEEGEWTVRIESVDPDVQRVLERVEVARLDGSGKAFVDLDLPGTRLTGRTVDEKGAAIGGASVILQSSPFVRQPEQTTSEKDGRFELEGVEAGSYELSAEARMVAGEVASGTRAVEVVENREGPEVEIVLRRKLRVRGRVTGPDGLGVPAAAVGATAIGHELGEMSAHDEAETDVRGEFELDLPSGTRAAELQVQAPGYALRIFRELLEPDRELLVQVSPLAGTLEIEFARDPAWLDWRTRRPYLISSSGAKLFAGVLVKWAELNGVQNATPQSRLAVPLLEPGDYRICWLGPPGASGPDVCTPAVVEPLSLSRVRTP